MGTCIAFLRGINVGKAKRIGMADLRALLEKLGFSNVRTILNSGNAIFDAARANPAKVAASIEAAIVGRFGFASHTVVVTASDLESIVADSPFGPDRDPSRLLVAFVRDPGVLQGIGALGDRSWRPDVIAIGRKAAYLWCAAGILESKLLPAVVEAAGGAMTTRNWATVLKLRAAAAGD